MSGYSLYCLMLNMTYQASEYSDYSNETATGLRIDIETFY